MYKYFLLNSNLSLNTNIWQIPIFNLYMVYWFQLLFFLVICRCAFSPWAPQHPREILPHGQNQLAPQYGRQQQSHNVLLRQRHVSRATKCYLCCCTESWVYCLFVGLETMHHLKSWVQIFKDGAGSVEKWLTYSL